MADDAGLASFWELLKAGDVGGIVALFSSFPHLEEPFAGTIHGEEELRRFVDAVKFKYRVYNSTWEHTATTATSNSVVCEWQMLADLPRGHWAPPVAAVGDLDNGKFSSIRVYYSTWPQTGNRGIRLPTLPHDRTIVLEGIMADYQQSLATGNLEGILHTFEESGTRRDARGGPYENIGLSQLREFYETMFGSGGIPLRYCMVTDDGRTCAIEYICDKWGDYVLPPQAGVAVYVRGDSGRIAAVRVYDDVEPMDINPNLCYI